MVVTTWIEDLTVNGVWKAKGGRHQVCKFDKMNLRLSGQAILNSCTQALKDAIIRKIPDPRERTGPLVYLEIILLAATLSISHTRLLTDKLEKDESPQIQG